MEKEELQFKIMTSGSPKNLVIKLGIPTVISMLITAIYNMADTYFVSGIDVGASGAVGIIFPLMAIIQAVGFTFGNGGGSYISSKLGEKQNTEAQKAGSSSFYLATVIGLLISVICTIFIKPIVKLLGATPTNMKYCINYARYIIFGFPIMVGSFVMNNILRSEGKSKLAMIGLTAGGILNIILDPILINACGLGISGAAIATVISQSVSYLILLMMFITKRTIITLNIKYISNNASLYFEIIKVGLPSMLRQGLAAFSTILLNNQAGILGGDTCQDAISIVNKLFNVIFSISLGIGQGYQPVCGYNYFARKYDRVKEAFLFTFISSLTIMIILCVSFFVFSENIMGFFNKNSETIFYGSLALRSQCITLPFLSFNVMCNMTFQSMRKKKRASLLSSLRHGIFFIPLIFILPNIFNINGVLITQAVSDFFTFALSLPFFIYILKYLDKKNNIEMATIK